MQEQIEYNAPPATPALYEVTLVHADSGQRRTQKVRAKSAEVAKEIVSGDGWLAEDAQPAEADPIDAGSFPAGEIGQFLLVLLGLALTSVAIERFIPRVDYSGEALPLTDGEILAGFLALLCALVSWGVGVLITIARRLGPAKKVHDQA